MGSHYWPNQAVNSLALCANIQTSKIYATYSLWDWCIHDMLVYNGDPGFLSPMSSSPTYMEQIRAGDLHQCLAVLGYQLGHKCIYWFRRSCASDACDVGPSVANSSTDLCDGYFYAGIAVGTTFRITIREIDINRFDRTSIIGLVRLVIIIDDARALDSTCKSHLIHYSARDDSYWLGRIGATTMVGVWSVAEPCLGIVAACLPTMGPLVTMVLLQLAKLRNGLNYSWSLKKPTDNSSAWATNTIDRVYNDLQPLQGSNTEARTDTYITSGEIPKASVQGHAPSIPLNAIEVNTTTSWTDQ